ncbi:hypothetical protein [Kineococcus sp. SYSU DK002]|uniref:hypothetical protein n=1 Tax=Kineococcus sp. SYSU DK002 TaxID=3383123 RepID=UPI003D7E6A0F
MTEIRFAGKRCAELRRGMRMRREELAYRINRSNWSVIEYELERKQPPLAVAATIADVMGVPLDELLVRDRAATATEAIA